MRHGGSSRRRQKMEEREQVTTNVVGRGPQGGGEVSITSTDNQQDSELGTGITREKSVKVAALALGTGIALASL